MTDLLEEVEELRLALRLSQAELAEKLGVSQGHYSKVRARHVPLTPKLATQMTAFLSRGSSGGQLGARETLDKCIEMMHVLRAMMDADKGGTRAVPEE